MKKILAVSGGVDSMVLLDIFKNDPEVVVAHFNHGTRPSADDDQKFVQKKCAELNIEFFTEKANLGENASEETAREKRYAFLNKIALREKGEIYTAHHMDDLIESVVINLIRGTGWRGLTPFSNNYHPLLNKTKKEILKYASENNIIFRQDPTNTEEKYLRNRVRESVKNLPEGTKKQIYSLFLKQRDIQEEIKDIETEILPKDNIYERKFFTEVDEVVALELLKVITKETEPVCRRFLEAIKTYAPEKFFNLSKNKLVKLHKTYFSLENL